MNSPGKPESCPLELDLDDVWADEPPTQPRGRRVRELVTEERRASGEHRIAVVGVWQRVG